MRAANIINRTITILCMIFYGDISMATPLFSESFVDNNFAARGWKSSWGGTIFNPPERGFDATINKNYVAIKYDAGTDTPHGMGDLDYNTIGTPQDEVTAVLLVNVVSWDFAKNNHMLGILSSQDPVTSIIPPQTKLEVTFFEPGKTGLKTVTPGWINNGPSMSYVPAGGGYFDQQPDGVTSSVITPGKWYEVRTRAKLNTIVGTTINSDGILTCQIRLFGTTTWTTTFNKTNIKFLLFTDGRQGKLMFPSFRMHRHPPGAAAADEIRIADWRVYQGNQLGVDLDPPVVIVPPPVTGPTMDQFNALDARVKSLESQIVLTNGNVANNTTAMAATNLRVDAHDASIDLILDKMVKIKSIL